MLINDYNKKKIATNTDIAKILLDIHNSHDNITKDREHLYIVSLDARNAIKNIDIAAIGSTSEINISATIVYRRAVIENASSIIIAHNHPSGSVTPSQADIVTVKKIVEAGELLGVQLLDSLIITDTDSYSMREHGDM